MVETLRLSCTPRGFLPIQTGRGREHWTDRGPSLVQPVARTLFPLRPAERCAQCKTIKTGTPLSTTPLGKRSWIHVGRSTLHAPAHQYLHMHVRTGNIQNAQGRTLAYRWRI